MRLSLAATALLALLVATLLPAAAGAQDARPAGQAVVALIDTGINPYHVEFRDDSALALQHPSTYLEGYPADAEALSLTLNAES